MPKSKREKPSTPRPRVPHTVPVLLNAIQVMEAVAREPELATVKGLAVGLGIAPSTCYRILQSYVASGWLCQGPGGTFALSARLLPLLRPLLHHDAMVDALRGPLQDLAARTGLTSKLTVRQGGDAVTIFSAPSPKSTAITSRVGMVISLAIGSSGAALLSSLDDVTVEHILDRAPATVWEHQKRAEVLQRIREAREQGCCYDHGSYQPHVHTMSAPIALPERHIVAAITVLGFPQDFQAGQREAITRHLRFTAGGCLHVLAAQRAAV